MFKALLSLSLLLSSFSLFSNESPFSEIIDFGTFPTIEQGYYTSYHAEAWKLGGYAFNYAPELACFFARLKRDYQIDTVVETGTLVGGTTVLFSILFDQVHTIEINENNYRNALAFLESCSNVQCHLGSSEKVLREILPSLEDKSLLFYLDAHWAQYWPLLDELEEISKTHKDNCIIVIDDFKVPGRTDLPYDAHNSHECSLEYIKPKLDQLFTSYTVHYVIPKSKASCAKFVAIPKQWQR